jgi:general nucleoside transport system permease protein
MDVTDFVVNTLVAALRAGTPLLIAALGETLCERSGVMNLGLEGVMVMGALSGFTVGVATESAWLGVVAAVFVGGLMALLHGIVSVSLKANQVVSGLALAILGAGLSSFLGPSLVGVQGPVFSEIALPVLSDIPILGPILFQQTALVYFGILLVPIVWYVLYKTRFGLHLRLVGENPAAADAVGINVDATRYTYVVIGGMLGGLAGASLSLSYTPGWKELMTAGRGWIALALVIFGLWDPIRTAFGALLFGAVGALQFSFQTQGIPVPVFIMRMMPYILTLVVLGSGSISRNAIRKRVATPEALGIPYKRGERS